MAQPASEEETRPAGEVEVSTAPATEIPTLPEPAPEVEDELREREWVGLFPRMVQDEVHYISDFFGVRLPETLGQYNLALSYTPRFGDVLRRDYLRFPLTLSYGLTERTDVLAGITPYAPSPFRSGDDSRWGPGRFRTGIRHDLEHPWFGFDRTSLGFDAAVPLGRPPLQLADHYGRLVPSISFTRQLERWPDTRFLLGLVHDHSFSVPFRSENEDMVRVNRTAVSPGLLYKPGNLGYLGEYTFQVIDDRSTGQRLAHVYTVGLLWEVPQTYVPRFLPGRWRVDTAYQLTDEEGRPLAHSFSTRVHVRFDFRRFFNEVQRSRQEFGQRFRGDYDQD
jgi:hypothetical protein